MNQESTPSPTSPSKEAPLSVGRLREAFAAMLKPAGRGDARAEPSAPKSRDAAMPSPPKPREVNPQSVIEAILFVGRPDNRATSARELAAAMRGVSPAEVEAAVQKLNTLYDADETPYRIEGSQSGYRLGLRDEFSRMRDKLYGRVREAKLSPAALEVLSVVAYNQPATAKDVNELRGAPSGSALSILVRRRLIRLDRPPTGGPPSYTTTDRFLKLFNLENLDALPRSEELEKV